MYAPKIFGVELRSYLVTDHQVITRDPYLNKVVFYTNVSLPWKSGKVVVSGSPDGTKPANIGWELQIYNSKSSSKSFRFNNSGDKYVCLHKDMPPLDITHLFSEGDNSFLIRFYRPCNNSFSSLDIGPVYLVHFDDYEISDEPFLDLPWDYEADNMRFEEVALRMSSYFDHEYPLLSTNLREPDEFSDYVVPFDNRIDSNKFYSSHDGYDWARSAGAILDDPVLAAAPGWATYHTNKYIGNAIYIDHDNGYQTRYYHLLDKNLFTKSSSKKWIDDRQKIGEVGFSGNVRPFGSKGAHIHFMIIKDKDGNGSFDDNIPDGILDPFGWQGSGEDPWRSYSFTLNGKEQTGIRSTYLWKKSLKDGSSTLTSDGGTISNSGSNTTFEFPFQVVSHDAIFDSVTRPPVSKPIISGIVEEALASVGNTVTAIVRDGFDNLITSFTKKFTLIFSFEDTDIKRFDPNSLSIYSSSNGMEWHKEETQIDLQKGKASAKINHLTDFALMGERLDSIAPITTVDISGTQNGGYYSTPITLALHTTDEPTAQSLGVLYTGYQINDDPWSTYSDELLLSAEKEYVLEYYSEDGDGNVEKVQQLSFTIDFNPNTPTVTQTPTYTIAPTTTPTALPTPTQTPTQTLTTPPTSTSTPVPIADISPPNVIQPISPISTASPSISLSPSVSIADNDGEVKSVFAAESENDQITDSNSNAHSNILRNLFMIVIVLTTAIILIWYRVGKKNHFWD